MGDSHDFIKALLESLDDTTVKTKLKHCFAQCVDDLTAHIRAEMDNLRQSVAAKDELIAKLQSDITVLKEDNDCLEQYSRRNTLRIAGIPERDNEDVGEKILSLCNQKLDVPITKDHIERVHRTGKKVINATKPRPILVKFSSYGARSAVYKAKSILRPGGRHPARPWTLGQAAGLDTGQQQPAPSDDTDRDHQSDERDQNAEDVHDPTTTTEDDPQTHIDYSKVFISEDLTRHRQYLLWRARGAKRNKKINDCWSNDGQIIIKDLSNKIVLINSIKKT